MGKDIERQQRNERLLLALTTARAKMGKCVEDTVANLLCYILDKHENEPLTEEMLRQIGASFMGSKYNKKGG